MKYQTAFVLMIVGVLARSAHAQCGNSLNWQDSSCQIISSSQQLTTAIVNGVNDPNAWTVVSRHGEYIQSETECNIPSQVAVTGGKLVITTAAQNSTCGDWSTDGTVRTRPSSWPYVTGDVQWNTFSFLYGTITIRGSMPAANTGLWPAFWLLGSNCQNSNKFSGDTGLGGCPNIGQSGYREIDIVENYNGTQHFHVANPSYGIGNGCDLGYTWDTNIHTWQLVWTASSIKLYQDNILETTCNQAINAPMFLIMQIQTGGVGGTPTNSLLPANMAVDYVKVQDLSGSTIFYDDFTSSGLILTLSSSLLGQPSSNQQR